MGYSYGYNRAETATDYHTDRELLMMLIDIVSRGGNLLLDIGPKADGTIPVIMQERLHEIGDWLRVNGEAIYGTRPWRVFGEGPTNVIGGAFHDTENQAYTAQDFRFTTKGKMLYAIELAWPTNGEALIHSIGEGGAGEEAVASVELLGSDAKLIFQQRPDGLHIQLPKEPPGQYAFAYRINFKSSQ